MEDFTIEETLMFGENIGLPFSDMGRVVGEAPFSTTENMNLLLKMSDIVDTWVRANITELPSGISPKTKGMAVDIRTPQERCKDEKYIYQKSAELLGIEWEDFLQYKYIEWLEILLKDNNSSR